MHIDHYHDVIAACRFCFMCRHLDPVGNVTFQEADTPRGRALILDRVRMDPENLRNPDFIETIYRSALSGANRTHCVSHYDEVGLVLAARRDIVDAGLAPERVKTLAEKLRKTDFSVTGEGSKLYFGPHPELYPGCRTISGGDPGKALEVLGFAAESREVLDRFRNAVATAQSRTLVVAEPSAYDFLRNQLDGISVLHGSEVLLSSEAASEPVRQAFYLESDFLRNYASHFDAPSQLLTKCGYQILPLGTNNEESYAAGEGAVVLDMLHPELSAKLCARVSELAGASPAALFITPSSYVKTTLKKSNPQIRILTLEEAVAERRKDSL